MSQPAHLIAYLVANAFVYFTLYRLYTLVFSDCLKGWIVCLVSFSIAFAINSAVYLSLQNIWITLATNIVLFIALAFLFAASLIKRIIIGICSYALFALVETLIIVGLKAFGLDVMQNEVYQIWGNILAPLTIFVLISAIIQHLSIRDLESLKGRHSLFMILIIIVLFALASVLPYLSADNVVYILIGIFALTIIAIFLFNFMGALVKATKERTARTAFEMQNKIYKSELELVKNYQREIKTIKHNIEFHMQTMHELVDKKEYERAKNYISGLTKIVDTNFAPISTGIPELDSIVNLKVNQAKQIGIEVKTHIKIEEPCKITAQDFISIIGNLMNNAIEAVDKINIEEERKIELSISLVKGVFLLSLINSYSKKPIKHNNSYLTTKLQKSEHGFGIEHVRSIVDKNNGIFEMDDQMHDKNIFGVKVLLYNN